MLPTSTGRTLQIAFSLPGSSPDAVEQQATSLLENAFSQIEQIDKIRSVSTYNGGVVDLIFDKDADISFKRFEVAAIIRLIYPSLPTSVSYPTIISAGNGSAGSTLLLIYSINAARQPLQIRKQAEEVFHTAFTSIPGINEVKLSGASNLQVSIKFNRDRCFALKTSPQEIISALQTFYSPSYPGQLRTTNGEQLYLQLQIPDVSLKTIADINVHISPKRTLRLKDVAEIFIEEQPASHYLRINGKNSITLSVFAKEGENQLALTKIAREVITSASQLLPRDIEVSLEYDNSKFIGSEISKNYWRASLSMGILLCCVFFAYRSWRHMLTLFFSLFGSLCITIAAAWVCGIDIHLYTIAGLAISFGILMDNAIVVLDNYHRSASRKHILALIGTTCTTIAAVCVVFLLPDEDILYVRDLGIIITLALSSSLITSIWLIPGLYQSLKLAQVQKAGFRKSTDTIPVQKFNRSLYSRTIAFLFRFRKFYLFTLLLCLGIPLFLLPEKWEGERWYNNIYNRTIGSRKYQEDIRPITDKWLGGATYFFINKVYKKSGYRSPEKTKLYLKAEMPIGNTAEQLNDILADFETYLSKVNAIDKYITNISSGQYGSIEISFADDRDDMLPYRLKAALIDQTVSRSGVSWKVYGIGQGFSNEKAEDNPTYRIAIMGYNLNELEQQAIVLQQKLTAQRRIHDINIDQSFQEDEKQGREYALTLDLDKVASQGSNMTDIFDLLRDRSMPAVGSTTIGIDGQSLPLVVKEGYAEEYSSYDLLHSELQIDSFRYARVGNFGQLELTTISNNIHRENRQYVRIVSFEYTGSSQLGHKLVDSILDEMKREMPIGFSVEEMDWGGDSEAEMRKYALVGLLIIGIFFIGSILFENMKQSLLVILSIPLSFVGLFLVFSISGYYFDQGGYAAFLMLGALTANSAIFIINDFNLLCRQHGERQENELLMSAVVNRSRTILLTTLSSCCGLIPFLLEGQEEVFWFSFALGTLGGLVFSLFSIFLLLPVLLWKRV